MIPIKASAWLSQLSEDERIGLRAAGMVPVNDVFFESWTDPEILALRVKLFFGGYGSGKSVDRCLKLLDEAAKPGYFRCYFGRKVLEDVRGSVHATLCDVIEDNGLQADFKYSREPNGTMVIRHKNGNQLLPFGAGTIDGLKSIKDPTHFFLEELDQFTAEDFAIILSRLRTIKARTELWGAFNTAAVMPKHWIISYFFPERNPDSDAEAVAEIKEILDAVGVYKLFCNYTDNFFLDQVAYYNTLRLTANNDVALLRAIAEGDFGVEKTGQEFYKAFSSEKHIGDFKYDDSLPLHISWDDNVNPYLPLGIFQLTGNSLVMIDEIAGKTPKNTIDGVCTEFLKRYGNHRAGLYIYGDATSQKQDTKLEKGHNFYTLIAARLSSMRPTMRLNRSNPSVKMRGDFINAIFDRSVYGLSFKIDRKCGNTISDFMRTQEAADGTKHKAIVKDPKTKIRYQQWGHFSDLSDYIIVYVFGQYYQQYTKKKTNLRQIASIFR